MDQIKMKKLKLDRIKMKKKYFGRPIHTPLGVDIIEGDFSQNPNCSHGPTTLFERIDQDGDMRRFYACSACRDRRDCPFFFWADKKFTTEKRTFWEEQSRWNGPEHKKIYDQFKIAMNLKSKNRRYCLDCDCFIMKVDENHGSCRVICPVSDSVMKHPTTLLAPKVNVKFEAQFLFTSGSVDVILDMTQRLGASRILCIGSPRIHEAVRSRGSEVESLLMDIDSRFHSFFPPDQFILYNMFNHHFFGVDKSKETYKQFLRGKDLVVVTDPPFGGRMELLAQNLRSIEKDWNKENNFEGQESLPVLFVFPYFSEQKVLENLPSFTMLDYFVDYDNHPIYSTGPKGMKKGSAVRVFVNRPANIFPLPADEGYSHCALCDRWVHAGNVHCAQCNGCMSKDGQTYQHCIDCKGCVKPTWQHCATCQSCQPLPHECAEATEVTCHICQKLGHKRKMCPERPGCVNGIFKKRKRFHGKSSS